VTGCVFRVPRNAARATAACEAGLTCVSS